MPSEEERVNGGIGTQGYGGWGEGEQDWSSGLWWGKGWGWTHSCIADLAVGEVSGGVDDGMIRMGHSGDHRYRVNIDKDVRWLGHGPARL